MIAHLKNIIKIVDIFCYPIDINFKHKSTYKSTIGGFISLLLIILYILIIIILLDDLVLKNNQKILHTKVSNKEYLNLNFNNTIENINFSDPNNSIFFVGFYFFNKTDNKPLSLSLIEKNMYITIKETERFYTNGTKNTIDDLKLDLCNNIYVDENKDIKTSTSQTNDILSLNPPFNNYDSNYLYCFDKTYFKIKGNFFSEDFKYISIKFSSCNDNDNPNKNNCDGYKRIENNLKHLSISLLYTNYNIEYSKHNDKFPIVFSTKSLILSPLNNLRTNYDIFITQDVINSNENLLYKFTTTHSFYVNTITNINKGYESLPLKNTVLNEKGEEELITKTYISVVLRSDNESTVYTRIYKDFFQFLTQIGGIWKIIFIIGGLIIIPINKKMYFVDITNKTFNLLNPKLDMSLQSYEHFKHDLKDNLLVKVGQPCPLEAEVCVNYYRYERCKGLNYNMISDNLIYYLTKCFLKNKNNSGELYYIKLKHKIFDSAAIKLNKKLAISNIYMFLQNIKRLKHTIINNYSVLIDCSHKNIISTDKLDSCKSKYNLHKYDNESDPKILSLNKAYKLVLGLRAIKNKPLLNEKIDYNLIKYFNFNNEFLKKYFVAHAYLLNNIQENYIRMNNKLKIND